ncbi:MAG: HYR domain-containing protein [bacterium]|nr:HYR domain-containing protein [bacterium]
MLNLTGTASGYAAFLDYDLGVLSYRGDLSSYTATPFPLNISPILQPDDGLLELDGSLNFMDPPTSSNALLATLVFDVLVGCDPATLPIDFEVGGTFPSELSLDGVPIDTTLTPPAPFSLDDTPPIFPSCPDVVQAADASLVDGCVGAIVNYVDPVATDNCPGVPTVVCSPPSGSMFLVGTTPVTCTATDACGNASMCMFNVTVTPTNVVCVEVELIGVSTPVTRCIRFVADDCSFADVSLSFIDHDAMMGTPVRAIAEIEIPCGEYASLCAKDEQHTKWETVTMSLSGVKYVTDTLISLTGGDTDNDGDVDINDVTWFLFQFGDLTAPGGCPWNGTRDADFSNNGAIGSEDYTFLTANWLTTSTCACTFPAEIERPHFLPARQRATSARARAVDLNQDGWVDFADVEIFEKRHGLPHELSKRMRQ